MITNVPEMSELQSFHNFVGRHLASQPGTRMSPAQALAEWREYQASLAAIKEGIEDIAAGRVKSFEEFDRDFRKRHGLPEEP